MKLLKFRSIFLCLPIILFSCKGKKKQESYSFRDSVIHEYLTHVDTLEYIDPPKYRLLGARNRLLKAYVNNDIDYLKIVRKGLKSTNEEDDSINKVFHYPNLKKMMVDEGYQVFYGETFCDYNFDFTISKKGDSVNLHSVIHQLKRDKRDSLFCALIEESDKSITAKDWNSFTDILDYTDYWGLKDNVDDIVLDGADLRITGIYRGADHQICRYQTIERQFVSKGLYNAYAFLHKLSGFKEKCGR